MFSDSCSALFKRMVESPSLLKRPYPLIKALLRDQSKSKGQGTGNQVTDHEASVAGLFEEHGFKFLPKDKKGDHLKCLPEEGLYYIYQVNGTQQPIDFQLLEIANYSIKRELSIDLKHSTSEKIMLNDGWFHENVVYVITYELKKELKTLVALGQNIPTAEEDEAMRNFREIILELRKKYKDINKGSDLTLYPRSANQYSCRKFDSSFCEERLTELLDSPLLS